MLAMVVSSLCFPMLGVVVRAVRQQDDVFTVMFFSGLLNCIALWTVLLVREKRRAFRTSIPHVHLIRGALGALGATSIVYSMKFVQVDLALTVLMSSPVWSALLARFWLREELNWATWLAIGLGFCGILITANPGVEGLNLWVLLILVPAVGMSLQNTMMTRYTGLGESPWKWSAFNELGILVSSCLLWFSLERTFVDLESAWLYLLIPAFLLPAVYFVSYASQRQGIGHRSYGLYPTSNSGSIRLAGFRGNPGKQNLLWRAADYPCRTDPDPLFSKIKIPLKPERTLC